MSEMPREFHATNVDCLIAILIAIGLPIVCGLIYPLTGALLPLILYYGVCCVGVVKWRRGSLEYRYPQNWALLVFFGMIALSVLQQVIGLVFTTPQAYHDLVGVLLTLFIWVPINSCMEQLSWIYCFDAFATRFPDGRKKVSFNVIGVVIMLMLVGLIHAFFWAKFTPAIGTSPSSIVIFFALQFIITPLYIVLYRKTHSMVPLALVHV